MAPDIARKVLVQVRAQRAQELDEAREGIYLLFVCLFIYLSISLQAQLPDIIIFKQKKASRYYLPPPAACTVPLNDPVVLLSFGNSWPGTCGHNYVPVLCANRA